MKFLAAIAVFLFPAYILLTAPGCANIIPPQGGPRDSLPPRLIRSTPPDSSRNFTGNRVSFVFDEFVDVQNIQEHLVVSPIPRISPAVDFRLNTVTLRLKDPLEPNTTYHFNFGKAVRDFTEGNPAANFTYTFSTGPHLDSLELAGKVILAETGKIDSTLVVMLHLSPEDSAVVKEKPRYVTRLDRQGNFRFHNLPARTFYLYALKDEGGSLRYFNERQLFAFADTPVRLPADSTPVTLYAYSVSQPARPTAPISPRIGRKNTDDQPDRRLRYQTSLTDQQQDLLSPLVLSFDPPLRWFDSTKMKLYRDSLFIPVAGYRVIPDSSLRRITVQVPWTEATTYHLVMDKDFAEDSSGRKLLRNDTLKFTTRKPGDYGSLQLRFRNLDLNRRPVLLMYRGDVLFKSYPLTGSSVTESLFLPGEYELRILYDSNQNGKWDPGEFFGKRKQPEVVRAIDRKINVKASAPNEFEITL